MSEVESRERGEEREGAVMKCPQQASAFDSGGGGGGGGVLQEDGERERGRGVSGVGRGGGAAFASKEGEIFEVLDITRVQFRQSDVYYIIVKQYTG